MSIDNTIAVGEADAAKAISMSVHWLRKDRRTKRLIPFYRVGNSVRYNLTRVREALATVEEGGASRAARGPAKQSNHNSDLV